MSEQGSAGLAPEVEARLRAQVDLELPPERWPAVAEQLGELMAGIGRLEELDLAGIEPAPLWRPDVAEAPSGMPPDAVGRARDDR